jgi:uridine kinase
MEEDYPQVVQSAVVVAIAGPSGSGKTQLVQEVAVQLNHATQVYFDDYESLSKYPADLAQWLAEGANPNLWQTPQLARDLAALRMGQSVSHPTGKQILKPTAYIVVEEPFGRERREMAPLLDYVVVIDLPLEIALARRIRRTIQTGLENTSADRILDSIDKYLNFYISMGTALYSTINQRALSTCDLAVDGRVSIQQIAAQVVHAIRARFPLPNHPSNHR